MNNTVRKYLINVARTKNKFVYYSDVVKDCNLGFDLSNEYGQYQLSVVLGEVSTYENEQERPLISSLAIYKNERKNDHGDGFYKLAQTLGKGKAKQLREDLYAFEEAEKCRSFWQNEIYYKQFFEIDDHQTENQEKEPDFFTSEEIEFFKVWQYKPYDPSLNDHVRAKTKLMDTVWEKSKYLGQQIVKRLPGFQCNGKKYWSQRGWKEHDGNKVQAAVFKPYTWIKIYRDDHRSMDIFFSFGIDVHPNAEGFFYKIDIQRTRDSKLSDIQIKLADTLIPDAAKWNKIPFEKLLSESWKSLTEMCIEFINSNLEYYDATVNAVWGGRIPSKIFKNTLISRDRPIQGFDEFPKVKRKFEEIETDFVQKSRDDKHLGDAGEILVVNFEIHKLESIGRSDLAKQVKKVNDGKGYDVLSFDDWGNTIYIEVKTTKGNELTPFYLSENELEFLKLNHFKYLIYRIYNFNLEDNFGEFFKISGDVKSQLLFKPIAYQVLLKNM